MRATRRNASPDSCLAESPGSARFELSCVTTAAANRHDGFLAHSVIASSRSSGKSVCEQNLDGRAPDSPRRLHSPWRALKSAGFTIIELMIVVVIVAILAMIAYPSYEDHMRKGRRSAAMNFLSDVATRQQQYMLDARQYAVGAGALVALRMTVPTEVAPFYTLTIDPAAPTLPPSFTLIATPVAGSRQVPDGALTLDSTGAKTRNGQPGWK